jgi:STE24 endopeptidase
MRFLLALLLLTSLSAQTPPTLKIPAGAEAGPAFDVEAATNAYLATIPPAKKARSDAYFEGGYWIVLWDFLFGAVVSLFLLRTRLSARLRDNAERLTRRKPLVTWLYFAQYSLVVFALTLPLTIYEGFVREHQYNLSNLTFPDWFIDEGKALALSIVLGGLAVTALFSIARRLNRTWHIWGAIAAIVFFAISIVITPVFILPMFNKYTVLSDARIRDPILRIARQNGIPANNVYQVDASRQSNRVSANVSGFLGTQRITLNDNLLKRCSPQAIMAVMGHEMGHYVLNHQYKMLAFLTIVIVLFFAILRWALTRCLARWGTRWEIRAMSDPAILPLATLILSTLSFLYTPIDNTLVRTEEYEADIFGLNTARQPDGFAEAALILGDYRKLDPSPLEELLLFDHPSGRTRIHAAMRWKAENQTYDSSVH